MTPVQMVQEWLTAIGETEYDQAHRERLLWEELREFQAAADHWHDTKPFERPGMLDMGLVHIADAVCDLAYVAIGSALLTTKDLPTGENPLSFYTLEPTTGVRLGGPMSVARRAEIEGRLYKLFDYAWDDIPIRHAATCYGFGDKLEACFSEVHRANMAKLECEVCGGLGEYADDDPYEPPLQCCQCRGAGRQVHHDADGKIINPAGWKGPGLGPILFGGAQ